jgi:ABC-type bacteriocin/lantibiotic exporter with double-glycine peptidase domain
MIEQSILLMLKKLWSHIEERRRGQIIALIAVMIITSFFEILSIGAVLPFLGVLTTPELVFNHQLAQPLINILGLNEAKQLLLPLSIIFALASIISGLTRVLLTWMQTKIGLAIGADLSVKIYRNTLYQPYEFQLGRNSSEKISGVTSKTNSIVFYTTMPALTIISSGFISLSILVTLIAIEPIIAVMSFGGFGIIYALVIMATKKRLLHDSQCVNREGELVLKTLQEGLGSIRNILIDGTQKIYCEIYQKVDIPHRRAIANIQIISNSPRYIIEALGMVLITSLAYALSGSEKGIESNIAILGAFALSAQRLLPALQQGYSSWTMINGGKDSLRAALDLLDQDVGLSKEQDIIEPITFNNYIQIENLHYKYISSKSVVLRDLTLNIPKGSRVGIVGTSGSGKSTLLDIIMGLLISKQGTISVDGVIITEKNRQSWQKHIAHVPQVIFLADTSIEENIAFGIPKSRIDKARVKQAAEIAQIGKTIELLTNGYDTRVGEHGVHLSGGQRQRIGIARALYKQADVIIFDEATSALDSDTEFEVMRLIENLSDKITIIIVAHRISTLKNCNFIYEVNDGSIRLRDMS